MSGRAASNVMGAFYLLVLLVAVFSVAPSPVHTSQAQSVAVNSLTATITAVDTESRSLDVITGVGHALRSIRIHLDPTCRIMVAGAAGQLRDLERGDVVRIEYRKATQGNMASTIEAVRPTPNGRRR